MEREDRFTHEPAASAGSRHDDAPARPEAPVAGRVGPPPRPSEDWRADDDERSRSDPGAIRAEDTEPYMALQYVARLFKIAAMVVVVALVAEVVAGIILEGAGAILPLMAEVIRGIVLAAILWGAGDLTLLLIDVGHDVRAARVLLGRLSARAGTDAASLPQTPRPR